MTLHFNPIRKSDNFNDFIIKGQITLLKNYLNLKNELKKNILFLKLKLKQTIITFERCFSQNISFNEKQTNSNKYETIECEHLDN